MTDNEYLQSILKQQTLSEGSQELEDLREHRGDVETLLRSEFSDSSPTIRYGGSKAKGTMVREAYDLDVICYFSHGDEGAGTTLQEIFENVRAALQEKYHVEEKAVAARVSAAKMGFIVSDPNAPLADSTTEKSPATMDANPGSIEELPFGKRFEAWDPDHPTSQFGAFCKELKRKIASGLSVFYNVLANDAEGVSYSSMRSFSLIERDDWRQIQRDFVDLWRRRIYREWLDGALLTGALRLPSRNPNRYLAVAHRCRGWDWIDPEKAAKGAVLGIQNGLGTRTAFLAERGLDLEDVFRELKRENELAAEYGISIDGDPGDDDERLTAEEWADKQAADDAGDGGNGADRSRAIESVGTPVVTGRPRNREIRR